MTSKEVREGFLQFFEERGHQRVPSASVVPKDDPTLYFTNAGMNQFKDMFLGLGRRDYTRAVDTQKCIRVSGKHNDLDEVGISPRHHTFFEMLGNWSFGDYFKQEAITWAWELVTQYWGLEKERLWSTVFEGDQADGLEADEEAERLWTQCTDQRSERVVRLPAEDVFWEMGATGPCGPSSELHYYLGDDLSRQSAAGLIEGADDYLEIWNLVFIQFNRDETGTLTPLPAQHVDTGMGFERITSILQGVKSNYDTDIFRPLIGRIAELSGRDYSGADMVPMQVIADHIRALTFALADGALPANEGAGYVLRRILRRAARYGRQLDQHDPFIYQLVGAVADTMGEFFPEVAAKQDHVSLVVRAEEESFGRTLDRGLEIFGRFSQGGNISGEQAFQLYDTYGFPLDLTQLMAREQGLDVDEEGFNQALKGQRERSRRATKDRFAPAGSVDDALAEEHSEFVGYQTLESEARIVHLEADEEGGVRFFLDRTPFYAEAGGQVGDRGLVEGDGFALVVEDTRKDRGGFMHLGRLAEGDPGRLKGQVVARVEAQARRAAARNHTATHLFHQALRQVLGDHVGQMGSLVSPDRLRFDFSHYNPIEAEQLRAIEALVNEQIRANIPVETFEEELETAREMGAQALFGEKYENRVRVVKIGDFSLELCGGTHVQATGECGLFQLLSESGIAAGTRRGEALTGEAAEQNMHRQYTLLNQMSALINAPIEQVGDKVEAILQQNRVLERDLEQMRQRLARLEMGEVAEDSQEVDGCKVVARRVEIDSAGALRALADNVRESLGSGVGVLGAVVNDKVALVAVVTDDVIKERNLQAGDIVRQVAQLTGGSGGGKAHMAQAGGREPEKLDGALAAVPEIVAGQLGR